MLERNWAHLWTLDDNIDFLNHGSFGACPRVVLEYQQSLRDRLERQPVQMLWRDLPDLIRTAREALCRFVGAAPEGLVFVQNATTGVNAVLRSLELRPGDELLVTNHAYGACRNAVDFVAERAGARVVEVALPFPIAGPDEVTERVMAAVTSRTRLALLDHVTSPTGLILPVQRLARLLRERGVRSLIDGAHAPGMTELSVDALDADYYVGNCHKWMCAPKSAGFLVVRAPLRSSVRPPVISHGATRPEGERFHAEFDWTGTVDPTAMLSVPESIVVLAAMLQGGWDAIRERNHAMALGARGELCRALGIEAPCPDTMIGSMAAVPIPAGLDDPFALNRILLEDYRIEALVYPAPVGRLLRVSAHLYNRPEQYTRLADVLPEALSAERRRT